MCIFGAGYTGLSAALHLADVNRVYDWCRNVYAGLAYNVGGIAMATLMGSRLASVVAEGKAALPIEAPRPVPLHRFHPLSIALRIAKGNWPINCGGGAGPPDLPHTERGPWHVVCWRQALSQAGSWWGAVDWQIGAE